MIDVSVIIPMYNVETYIKGAIRCVLEQSFRNFELLVIDDGSTDGSAALCDQFTDVRMRVITQENRGLAGARNTGIRHAKGRYLAFLDADDLWDTIKLARHVQHLDNSSEVGISYCQSRLMEDSGRPMGLLQKPKITDVSAKDIICRNPIGNGSVAVIRRSVLEEICYIDNIRGKQETLYFDETFRQSEDIECWIRIAATTKWRFEGIPEPLTWYRANAGGLSTNLEAQYESWNRVIEKTYSYAPSLVMSYGERARAYQLRYLARRAVHSRCPDIAVRLVHRALKTDYRILYLEPRRTLVTLACAWLQYMLPRSSYQRIEVIAMTAVGTVNRINSI